MGIKGLSICQEIFGSIPFDEVCRKARKHGYTGIELAPFMLASDIRQVGRQQLLDIKNTAVRQGLTIVAAHWLLVSPPGMSITTPDTRTWLETKAFIENLVDVAAVVGIPVLVFGSPKQRNIDSAWGDFTEAYQRGVKMFKSVMHACERSGVVIAIEPLGPKTTNLAATFADAMELIDEVDSPFLQLHLDVKAMHDDVMSLGEQIRQSRGRLVHFHANDTNLLGPGMGNVDFIPIIDALRKIEYNGWISIETFNDGIAGDDIARRSFSYLASILNA